MRSDVWPFHGREEIAYDLLAIATEAGSAPAHMYIADYFVDADPPKAQELLHAAVTMGFAPAENAWDALYGQDGEQPATGSAEPWPP